MTEYIYKGDTSNIEYIRLLAPILMRILGYGLLNLILLTSCSRTTTNDSQLTNVVITDSVLSESIPKAEKDTVSYIGYINKFDDSELFYTDLYFVDEFDYDLYNDITKMGSEVVYKDDEIRRTKMEIERVGQYFNLTGLRSIDIYNDKSKNLTTGQLSHIEYIEDLIESRFVAVFQVDNPHISEPVFCVGNSNTNLPEIDFSSYEDEKLKPELVSFLKLNTDHIWNIGHYKLNKEIFSTISADTTAYIIKALGNSREVLYKSKSNEAIHRLTVISNERSGRQIILTECGMPETDMMWTSVLTFNGTEYEVDKDHRITAQ